MEQGGKQEGKAGLGANELRLCRCQVLGRQMHLWLIKFLGIKNHQSPLIKKCLVHQAPALAVSQMLF